MESERGRRLHYPVAAADSSSSPANFIEHRVSKLDTLAGVAIKYGVEVGDIKRMNGLVTDLQMFALKKLRIPLPGRHPPSPVLANGAANPGESNEHMDSCHPHLDVFESFMPLKSKASRQRGSSAMSSLQGHYSVTTLDSRGEAEGTEMSVYRAGFARNLDKGHWVKLSPVSEPLPLGRRKAKSFINGFLTENGDLIEHLLLPEIGNGKAENCGDVAVGRHQKAEVEPTSPPPEWILKEDNASGGLSGKAGKNLALRPKSTNRALPTDAGTGLSNQNSVPMRDLIPATDGLDAVQKSSITSSLQSEAGSSIWPTSKWTLRPDLQSLTAVAITRPIFDGLPNPITGRRSKAALD